MKEAQFTWNYETLRRITGMSLNAVQQHVSRGNFKPEDLKDTILWIARHSGDEFKMEIFRAMSSGHLRPEGRRRPVKRRRKPD